VAHRGAPRRIYRNVTARLRQNRAEFEIVYLMAGAARKQKAIGAGSAARRLAERFTPRTFRRRARLHSGATQAEEQAWIDAAVIDS